ncbi:hypothetical protein LP419_02270 [Massilia sp. H-1]|nr:hypothetical protein LP419_02270 [Massilia sp. H-1]
MYQIARNRLLDLLRQQQPLLAAEMGTGTDGTDAFDALADGAQDVVTPETALDEKQRYDSLHLALNALPGEQKEALVLQQFNGLSLEEISAIVAAPVETVKSEAALRHAQAARRELV